MSPWMLAWGFGWFAISYAVGYWTARSRRPRLPNRFVADRSFRCADSKALPRAWTVKP